MSFHFGLLAVAVALAALYVPASWASDQVGLGALVGTPSSSLAREYAFIVEGDNHFQQRETVWGINQYGFAQSRLELGTSVGISLDAVSGVTLVGLGKAGAIAPHIGIEPFSGNLTWSTRADHASFYEWLPMASAGVQMAIGRCRLLPLVRAGGAVGNLRKEGLFPEFSTAIGASALLNCGRFNFAASSVRVGPLASPASIEAVDLSVGVKALPIRFGLRAEAVDGGTAAFVRPSESRYMVIFRGAN